ncbi:deoxyribonuclease V [Catalinimonas alkaloidigena]|uniref:Endonuclease V n=1 Tax=Catalinimonas alkaloidigena TaxID=1075417 RepID=A0A1G9F9G3_9BACT|nr:deoxyribonuclease V [Catalinimonas alkaloidigena]SDK84853.1 deoxyribonuclease V [Catalinimonas alkaloidigena]
MQWPTTIEDATAVQLQLRDRVIRDDQFEPFRTVAGVDVGFEQEGTITRAAVAVLDGQTLQLIDYALARQPTRFPYVPGYLSFREVPAVLEAYDKLRAKPDLLLCDGQGTAHPRQFGIACHLGVLLDLPSVGVGKSRLVGRYQEVPDERGAWQPLYYQRDIIGGVLRTRVGTKPLFISTGHRVSLETAIRLVMHCAPKYRLPETTRQAHKLASG